MPHALEDRSVGLRLKGYNMVPNDALENRIAIYTPDVVQSILSEHPEIVDGWFESLHGEYLAKKRLCDFENDPVACFTLSVYEEFEKHRKSWQDGGMIAISLPGREAIHVSKKPLITFTNKTSTYVCDLCLLTFGTSKALVGHYRSNHPDLIENVTIPI